MTFRLFGFPLHLHLFWQMVTDPRQQILPGPICKKIYGDNSASRMTLISGATGTNTVNIVNKLVTIFAGHLDSFVVTNNQLKRLKTTSTSGSGQINVQMTLIQFAGTGKNCAIPSAHRDNFPGLSGHAQGRMLASGNVS